LIDSFLPKERLWGRKEEEKWVAGFRSQILLSTQGRPTESLYCSLAPYTILLYQFSSDFETLRDLRYATEFEPGKLFYPTLTNRLQLLRDKLRDTYRLIVLPLELVFSKGWESTYEGKNCNVLSGDLRKGWYSAKISLQSPHRPDYILMRCAINFIVRSLDSVPLVSFSCFRLMLHSSIRVRQRMYYVKLPCCNLVMLIIYAERGDESTVIVFSGPPAMSIPTTAKKDSPAQVMLLWEETLAVCDDTSKRAYILPSNMIYSEKMPSASPVSCQIVQNDYRHVR
jgi:hypothetical protein